MQFLFQVLWAYYWQCGKIATAHNHIYIELCLWKMWFVNFVLPFGLNYLFSFIHRILCSASVVNEFWLFNLKWNLPSFIQWQFSHILHHVCILKFTKWSVCITNSGIITFLIMLSYGIYFISCKNLQMIQISPTRKL